MDTPHEPNAPLAHRPAVSARRLERPLRLVWLERRLSGRPGADEALLRARELDQRIQAAADEARRGDLGVSSRGALVRELTRLRLELDELVASVLGEPPIPTTGALVRMSPELRVRLAELLGVSLSPEHYPLLELKACEYMEQGEAFDRVAADFGFVEAESLGVAEPRGALVLTHNGSLLQMSAPIGGSDRTSRRFVYQNIYGGTMPAEGTLELVRPARLEHKVRTKHMETSPVRKLRLAPRAKAPWERQRETFRSVSLALTASSRRAMGGHTVWGASPAAHPSFVARSVELARADHHAMPARAELREHLLRLADPQAPPADPAVEADVIGLCMHLQRMRMEAGEAGHALADLEAFVTDRNERCVVGRRPAALRLLRSGHAPVTLQNANIGEQRVVRGAPVALIDGQGALAAVLGDVVTVEAEPR